MTAPYRMLSVIVPVYNERPTVAEAVRRMRTVELPVALEIIAVDDGSSDGTDKVLAALRDSTVRVLTHPTNRGKGAAIRTALQVARGDLVLIHDADLEYDPADWPSLVEPILRGEALVVYGSRFPDAGTDMHLLHRLGQRALTLTTNLLYAARLSDMETCSKLFDRKVLDRVTIDSDRFDVEPEITAKLLRQGHRIHEVPIAYTGRAASDGKKLTWRDGIGALSTLLRYRIGRVGDT